jgi:hypothetical protein
MSQTHKKQHQYGKKTPGKVPVKKNKWLMPTTITAIIAVVAIAAVIVRGGGAGSGGNNNGVVTENGSNNSAVSADIGSGNSAAVQDADLVIPVSEISATAKFYPIEIDGTKLEVIAVEAPDGTIRTAFNTCQVCYGSGRGYYEQDGDVLVCQNCGNRFAMNQVEVQSGGCNPVPIFPENKTVTDETITISSEFLTEAKAIFANWKTEY